MKSQIKTIDTLYRCETPEGVTLEVELAGPGVRTLAYAIDLGIRFGVLIILSISLSFMGKAASGLLMIAAFLGEWFYPVFFEIFRNGQTIGKSCMGIQVLQDDLSPVSFGSSLTRNLLRTADFLPLLYAFGFCSMLVNSKFKRLGDITAGTVVVHKPSIQLGKLEINEQWQPKAAPFSLSPDEQQAFLNFLERREQFSNDRQNEIAAVLAPTLKSPPAQVKSEVLGIAAWLAGKS